MNDATEKEGSRESKKSSSFPYPAYKLLGLKVLFQPVSYRSSGPFKGALVKWVLAGIKVGVVTFFTPRFIYNSSLALFIDVHIYYFIVISF